MNSTDETATKEQWSKAKTIYLSTLQSENEKSQVERYLSMVVAVDRVKDKFVAFTSNAFAADFLRDNYAERLKKCLELVAPEGKVEI